MTTRDDIIAAARGWIGTPYLHQASLKGVGCDCLGLVRGVWRDCFGHEPEPAPPYAASQHEAGEQELLLAAASRHCQEIPLAQVAAGDLLLFRWRPHLAARHAAIAVSPNAMVHAQEGAKVCEVALSAWWRRHLAHAFRFPVKD